VRQQEREPGVAGGRSSPHVKPNLVSEKRNGDGQSECHVPEMAVAGSKDTRTQGSTDSANRNAEIKLDDDLGGVTVGHDHTATHTWANPSLRNGKITSRPGGDEPRIGPDSSDNIQIQESSHRTNRYAEGWPSDGGLGMEAGGNIGVSTRESSHSINGDGESQQDGYGKGMAVSRIREDNSAMSRNAMNQPEGGEARMARMALGNHKNTHSDSRTTDTGENAYSQKGPILVNRNPKGRPGGGGRAFEGSNSPAMRRWDNPDSAGGLARGADVGDMIVDGAERRTDLAHRRGTRVREVE